MFATLIADIQAIAGNTPEIEEVYGFGSFFRSSNPHDCDLLVMVKSQHKNGSIHKKLHQLFSSLEKILNLPIDLVIVTADEFSTMPLDERDSLVSIYSRNKE